MITNYHDELTTRCHDALSDWFDAVGTVKPVWFEDVVPAALASVPVGWHKVDATTWVAAAGDEVDNPTAWLIGHAAEAIRAQGLSAPVSAAAAALILEAVPADSTKQEPRRWSGQWGSAVVDRRAGRGDHRLDTLAERLEAEAVDAEAQAASAAGRYAARLAGRAEGLRLALSLLRSSDAAH